MLAETIIRSAIKFLLQEGFVADKASLIELYPALANSLNNASPKAISWLVARYGENKTIVEIHPIEESISTLFDYLNKSSGITQKYMSNALWKALVDERIPITTRKWKLPSEIQNLSVDDMSLLMSLSSIKKQTVDATKANIQDDYLGKVGPWNLWLPSTTANSCEIAGYDPKTHEPYTSWCTARTMGENFFNSYLTKQKRGLFLVYIIHDNPSKPDDWISVAFNVQDKTMSGFRNPKQKQDGGWCVNADNLGYSEEDLKEHFFEFYEPIITLLNEKLSDIKEHPGQTHFYQLAYDVNMLRNACKGLTKYSKYDLFKDLTTETLAVMKRPTNDVIEYIINSIDPSDTTHNARMAIVNIATINDLPLEFVIKLNAEKRIHDMKISFNEIVSKQNSNPEVLKFLIDLVEQRLKLTSNNAGESIRNIILNIVQNPAITDSPHLLIDAFDVGKDITEYVTKEICKNIACKSEIAQHIIDILEEQEDTGLLEIALKYIHDSDVLETFVNTHEQISSLQTKALICNETLQLAVKEKLAKSADKFAISTILNGIHPLALDRDILQMLLLNPNASSGTLMKIMQNYPMHIPENVLNSLSHHTNEQVRNYAAFVKRQYS